MGKHNLFEALLRRHFVLRVVNGPQNLLCVLGLVDVTPAAVLSLSKVDQEEVRVAEVVKRDDLLLLLTWLLLFAWVE